MQVTTTRSFLLLLLAMLSMRGMAAITVDSVAATPSRCATDGTITVYAQSPSAMVYAIISGPDIRPAQSGRQFAALPRGSYRVMITNFSNDTAYANATVGGSYTFPDFAPTYVQPYCAGAATGMIVGNALPQGTSPYSWTITNTSTGISTTQASDTFGGLAAGTYSIRQTDSCQSFATRSITLSDPVHDFTISNINNEMWACDTVQVYMQLYLPGGNYAAPYTIQINTAHGTYQHIITDMGYGGWYPDFRERVGGVSYGDYINITITDACGFSQTKRDVVAPFNANISFMGRTDTCQLRYSAYAYLEAYPNQLDVYPTYMHGPVTVTLSDPISGVVLDSTVTYGDTIRRSTSIAWSPYRPGGGTYRFTMRDACGHQFTNIYQWPTVPTPYTSTSNSPAGCYDSTANFSFYFYNTFYTEPILELLSGPSTIHSSKPHYAYRDTIIYPQSYRVGLGSTTGVGSFVHGTTLSNFGVGTYTYSVHDSCGHTQTGSFTILPQDVSDLHYSMSYTKGCPGENTVNLAIPDLNFLSLATLYKDPNLPRYIYSAIDTERNLDAGTYILTLNYYRNQYAYNVNQSQVCTVMTDTVVIPPYQVPHIDYATQIKCHGTVNVGLQPDSSKGVAPYSYEIISGPQTATVQASNFFTLTQPGTYTARISDVCGFARTFTFFVDTLSFAQVVKVGSSCVGNTATLFSQHSPYATYIWQRPGGGTYTGDSLRLSPVQPTDYGVYHISKIVVVNGCRDTFYATYTLAGNTTVNLSAAICTGDSFRLGARVYYTAGTYRDTISTAGCDSITVLQLAIRSGIYDTLSRTICAGHTVTMGAHTYTATGYYNDTIAAAGCDTIRTLALQVTPLRRDSVVMTVCEGQTVRVGAHTYSTTGIYRDTFSTAGCDSLHILDLRVGSYQRDTFMRNICTGGSITVGSHVYNATGIYRDTFATAPCGLIIMTDLRVNRAGRDSVARSICAGQSVTVGTHTYTASGIYRDTFSTTGCDSIYILNLQVGGYRRDSVSLSLCTGQTVTVGAHTYSTTGVYRDTFATTGCDSIHVLNLQVGGVRVTAVSLSVCSGQSITVGAHTYSTTGIYRDTFATTSCDSVYELHLTVIAPVTATRNVSICIGGSVIVGGHIYTAAGVYRDTLTSSLGCDSIHILTLSVGASKRDTTIAGFCAGSSVTIDGVTYTQPGAYSDTIGTTGCDSIHTWIIQVWTSPAIHITTSAMEAQPGDTVQLGVSGSGGSYHWTSGAVLSNPSISDPTATIYEATWITVQATDGNGCTVQDSVYIGIGECDGKVFVPNAFTPNGDGINDEYRIYGRCIRLNSLKIFNRWGEKVWETEDINDTWDGTYRGAKQPPEVYVYLLFYSADTPGGAVSHHLQGSITLIR